MTTVRVSPPTVDVCDVLEYAQALIEEHGWRQGPRVPGNEDWPEVAKHGLSLHDSIGMACYRLSGETGAKTQPPRATMHSKDYPLDSRARQYGYSSKLRTDVTEAAQRHTGDLTDIEFNDTAANVTEVLKVLDEAIKEACSGRS